MSFSAALNALDQVILGKSETVKKAVVCMLAGGHLLIEDLPGMGKTTLAHALARVFALEFQRIQFTSDMLPADIVGVSIFDPERRSFQFRPGPVFTQLLLADEINRATPKTQSALLEAMEEKQATVDGESHPLPTPFFVIATQNPVEQGGTFPLPESQLDRFLMCLSLGYPSEEAELSLLASGGTREQALNLAPMLTCERLLGVMEAVRAVKTSESLLQYLQRLLHHSRHSGHFTYGLSPRAGLGLLRASQAWALLSGRHYVVPEDIQVVLGPVVNHRLVMNGQQHHNDAASLLLNAVPVLL